MRPATKQLIPAQRDPIEETFDSKRGKFVKHYNSLPLPFLNLYQKKLSLIYCLHFLFKTFLHNDERTELKLILI